MSSGNIRNTEKLSYDKQHQYEILVTASDCGQKPAAQDTLVQVDVKPVCKPGWQGGPAFSVLWSKGSLTWRIGAARTVLKSSHHVIRGIFKVQSHRCKKHNSLFILTTPGGYIVPILQVRISEVTRVTHVPSFSSVLFLKSHDSFGSIVIIPGAQQKWLASLFTSLESAESSWCLSTVASLLRTRGGLGLHRGSLGRGWRSRIQPVG